MGQYEVTMICSPGISKLEEIENAIGELPINDLLTLKKDIVQLINKKLDETNDH